MDITLNSFNIKPAHIHQHTEDCNVNKALHSLKNGWEESAPGLFEFAGCTFL